MFKLNLNAFLNSGKPLKRYVGRNNSSHRKFELAQAMSFKKSNN